MTNWLWNSVWGVIADGASTERNVLFESIAAGMISRSPHDISHFDHSAVHSWSRYALMLHQRLPPAASTYSLSSMPVTSSPECIVSAMANVNACGVVSLNRFWVQRVLSIWIPIRVRFNYDWPAISEPLVMEVLPKRYVSLASRLRNSVRLCFLSPVWAGALLFFLRAMPNRDELLANSNIQFCFVFVRFSFHREISHVSCKIGHEAYGISKIFLIFQFVCGMNEWIDSWWWVWSCILIKWLSAE